METDDSLIGYGGIIAGASDLTKSGNGILTLSSDQAYTGDTLINAGTLRVTGTLSDSTDVIISSPGIYDVDGSDTIQSLVEVEESNW